MKHVNPKKKVFKGTPQEQRAKKEQQRIDNKIKKLGYEPTENRRLYIKEYEKFQRRLKAFERKTGIRISPQEFGIETGLPKRITKGKIESLKELGAREFKHYTKEQGESAPDIADIVISNLKSFIISYAESKVGDNDRAYNIAHSGASMLLDYLDRGIAVYGKSAVARNAERLDEQMSIAAQYMDESNSDRAGMLLSQFGEVVFGRAFSFAELVGMERYNENNGHYA